MKVAPGHRNEGYGFRPYLPVIRHDTCSKNMIIVKKNSNYHIKKF